jgi:hypothetical protein
MSKVVCALLIFIPLVAGQCFAREYPVERSDDPISERDMRALLASSGTSFERYDFDLPFDFCLNVLLQQLIDDQEMSETPFGHLCNLAGPYRLMVIWRRSGDEVNVWAQTHRRDEIPGGGGTGTAVSIPGVYGSSTRLIEAPKLSPGKETLLADFEYTAPAPGNGADPAQNSRTRLRVFVELKPNPHQEQSSGGSHVD